MQVADQLHEMQTNARNPASKREKLQNILRGSVTDKVAKELISANLRLSHQAALIDSNIPSRQSSGTNPLNLHKKFTTSPKSKVKSRKLSSHDRLGNPQGMVVN